MTPTLMNKQTIASEQKRINGQTFSRDMIRTPKPPPSPASTKSSRTITDHSKTKSRVTGVVSGLQEIRIQQLQQAAFPLHHGRENPLITAINETVEAGRLGGTGFLGRTEYEAVERRLEFFIQRRGGRVPSRE